MTKKTEETKKKTTRTRKKAAAPNTEELDVLARLEQKLDAMEERLAAIEQNVQELQEQATPRSDWVDLSARLDIVEQNTNKTLGKVRNRLDTFTREVRQIAVVPERELNEMFELVRLVKRYLAPEKTGGR